MSEPVDATREAVDGIRDAQASGQVVRILRHQLDEDGAEVTGIVTAHSEKLAVVRTVDASLQLDGLSVIFMADITEIEFEFRRDFHQVLAEVSEWRPVKSPAVALDSVRAMLESVNTGFSLMGVHCEMSDVYAFEVGRIQMITDESLVIRRIDRWAELMPPSPAWSFDEITRVSFGSVYLQNLWSVAMHLGSFDAKL